MDHERFADGSALLLAGSSGAAFALNATAAEVWELCDGERGLEELLDVLADRYEVEREEARRSVSALLDELGAVGAIES